MTARLYENFRFDEAYEHAMRETSFLTQERTWHRDVLIVAIEHCTSSANKTRIQTAPRTHWIAEVLIPTGRGDAPHVDHRLEAFWGDMRVTLHRMTLTEFQKNVQAIVKYYTEKPQSQEDECHAFVDEVLSQLYEF